MKNKKTWSLLVVGLLVGFVAWAHSDGRFAHKQLQLLPNQATEFRSDVQETSNYNPIKTVEQTTPRNTVAEEGIEIYAFTESNITNENAIGLIKFNSKSPGSVTHVKNVWEWATAGAYAEQDYYVMVSYMMYQPTLYTVDLETGEMTSLVACTSEGGSEARQALEMSYDVISKTMYMIAFDENDENFNTGLYTVDLKTGEQKLVIKNMKRHIYAMAINAEGTMYGVDGDGMLCKIDKETGACTEVASTGLRPFYRQSMDFDRETGIVYWAYSDTWRYGTLYTLDVATAEATKIGEIGGKEEQQIVGMHVPYSLYSADAPSFVTDLTITPDAAGELNATLSWTCPTHTIGGDALESIDYVEITRDGVVVAKLENAGVGAAMTWSDNVEKAATYTYKVQTVNAAGYGELRITSAFIGHDVPAAVADLRLTRPNENTVALSWSAVTKGMEGGYIDLPSLRYKVTRTSDGVVLATDLTEASYTDNTITELNRYRYAIESYNVDGVGGVANSGYIVNGPARQLPVLSNFDVNDETEPNLWTVGDANGDGISFFWSYDEFYQWGAYYYQTFTSEPANDWLISPPVRLEENMPYKVVVEAKPANANQPEQFSIYLIQNYDLSTAIKIGDTFDVTSYDRYRANIDNLPAGNYSVCIKCTSGAAANYLAIYSVEVAENGDGNIRGDVWDDSSRPVADVYVSLDGTEFGGYTDERGFFEIVNVPAGNYTINSTKMGYKSVSQNITVKALKEINVELDVIKRKAFTVSGKVSNEYNQPLANAEVRMDGYNTYVAQTASDGTYSIGNVYEAETPYHVAVSKDFYTLYNENITIQDQNVVVDATLNDSILAPALAKSYLNKDKKCVVEWSTPGIEETVAEYSDMISYTFGASDGTFGTLIGVVCHEPVLLRSLNWLLLNSDSTINVVVLGFDENGKLSDKELYVDGDAPNVSFDMTYYTFDTEVYAPNGCFIGLSVDEGFLDIATAINTEEKPFVPRFNGFIEDYLVDATFEYVEVLGDEYCENFFLGYTGLSLVDSEAPLVTYNVYRENEAAMSMVVNTAVQGLYCTDDAWATLPAGDFQYAVTAVYKNGKESQSVYTNVMSRDDTGVEDALAEGFNVVLEGKTLLLGAQAESVAVYSTDGVQVAYAQDTERMALDSCGAGIYVVRAQVNGKWYVERIIVK